MLPLPSEPNTHTHLFSYYLKYKKWYLALSMELWGLNEKNDLRKKVENEQVTAEASVPS